MASTITERVYDDLTHKLRQWEKMQPAPYEVLGAIKSWAQLGSADIEAAANAAAGLAVKGGGRSVKAFANVPDVPAALAHLRTAHAAIKAQVDAERSAPPRDGGFAGVGVKAYPVVGAVTKLRDSIHMAGSNGLHIDKAKPVFQRWRAMLLAAGRLDPDVSKENDYRDLMRALSNVRDFQTGRELGQTLSYLVNTADDLLARIS